MIRSAISFFLLVSLAAVHPAIADTSPPTVNNSAQASHPDQTLHLTELWRIGGPDDEDNLLGVINEVFTDDAGLIYLLDIQLTEVQVFDQTGTLVRTLGQRGDGPGELRFVTDAALMPDGTVGLAQPFPGRIVQVDRQGLPAGELKPGDGDPTSGGFFAIHTIATTAHDLVISGVSITRAEGKREATHFIGRYNPDGTAGVRYLEKIDHGEFRKMRIVEKDEFFPHINEWALAPNGDVIIAPRRNEYRLEIHTPDGLLRRVFTREYTSVRRSDAERTQAAEMMMPWRRRNRDRIDFVMEPTVPDILQVRATSDGQWWVLPSSGVRHQAVGVHSTWDVFDATGKFDHRVAVACEGKGERDTLFFPGDNIVVLVKQHRDALRAFQGRGRGDAEDLDAEPEVSPLEVICYQLRQ